MFRVFLVPAMMYLAACMTSAPLPSLGGAQGASCVQNLDCSQGLFCMCQRCVAQEKQAYPSHCPHLDLISCDTSEGQCSEDCVDKTPRAQAECIENLWFCPESTQLIELCETELIDLDASVP